MGEGKLEVKGLYWLTFLLFICSVVWSLWVGGVFQQDLINVGGWSLVFRFLVAAVSPDMDGEFLLLTFDATLKTLAYAVCGTFFCVVIGLVGGVLSSEVWWKSLFKTQNFWLIVRFILAIPRGIHELIWGLFFVNIFGLDPLVGVLAIAIPFGAITAKVFADILDGTDQAPLFALLNSGVQPVSAFAYSIVPQAFLNLLSYGFYRFECSIRSATVLGVIGAGGLGYQILLSLQSLRYEQMWTLIFALLLLSGGTDFLSGFLRRRLGVPSRMELNVFKFKQRNSSLRRDPVVGFFLLAGAVLLVFSFWYIKADFTKLWSPRTAQLLGRIVGDAWTPRWIELNELFSLSTQTLAMSILASTGAGLGGILFSFFAARLGGSGNGVKLHTYFSRFLLLFARAVPEPIWALIFLFVFFPGIIPGAIALGLHNLGILGRLMAEVVENLDERPLRSLKALGASNAQVFLYGVLPSTLPRFLAYILYRWEVCIRATVIVGLVGAGGLGRLLTEQLSSFDYKGLLATLIVFMGLTFVVDLISASVRISLK